MAKAAKKQNEKPTAGRSELIHKLHAAKTPKAEAMEKVQEKFNCPSGLFDKIWSRQARGAEDAKPAKPAKKKAPGKTPPPAPKPAAAAA